MQHQNRAGPRLHALTGTSAGTTDGVAAAGPAGRDAADAGLDEAGPAPDVVDAGRALRERAVRSALAAYTAAHGHPVERLTRRDAQGGGAVRWTTTLRAAVGAVVVLGLLAGAVVIRSSQQAPSRTVPVAPAVATAGSPEPVATSAPSSGPAPEVVVHVVGEVVAPGLVRLPVGSRVDDALAAAGGPTTQADLAALNLARPVTDGEQVHVPRPGEPAGAVAPAVQGPVTPDRTDLNTADAAALEQLPGIGPVLAGRIVAWRTEHGRFSTVDELGEVTGIGTRLLEGLRDSVRVE